MRALGDGPKRITGHLQLIERWAHPWLLSEAVLPSLFFGAYFSAVIKNTSLVTGVPRNVVYCYWVMAIIFGIKIHGFIACWIWRSYYLANMPSISKKLEAMIDWTSSLFFKRDVAIGNFIH